jgi:hypothetical protein
MLTPMERQTRLAEALTTQFASFGMRWAEGCATVIAEGLRSAATRCAQLILHSPSLNDSANEVVHVSSREYTTGFCHGREKLIKYSQPWHTYQPFARWS